MYPERYMEQYYIQNIFHLLKYCQIYLLKRLKYENCFHISTQKFNSRKHNSCDIPNHVQLIFSWSITEVSSKMASKTCLGFYFPLFLRCTMCVKVKGYNVGLNEATAQTSFFIHFWNNVNGHDIMTSVNSKQQHFLHHWFLASAIEYMIPNNFRRHSC